MNEHEIFAQSPSALRGTLLALHGAYVRLGKGNYQKIPARRAREALAGSDLEKLYRAGLRLNKIHGVKDAARDTPGYYYCERLGGWGDGCTCTENFECTQPGLRHRKGCQNPIGREERKIVRA